MIVLIYATANIFMLRRLIYKQEGNRTFGVVSLTCVPRCLAKRVLRTCLLT